MSTPYARQAMPVPRRRIPAGAVARLRRAFTHLVDRAQLGPARESDWREQFNPHIR